MRSCEERSDKLLGRRPPSPLRPQLRLSLANPFSRGVFLSLAFGHLIPARDA